MMAMLMVGHKRSGAGLPLSQEIAGAAVHRPIEPTPAIVEPKERSLVQPSIQFTYFQARHIDTGSRHQLQWHELCDWLEQSAPVAAIKDQLPLIKLATFQNDQRSTTTLDQCYGIEADYDLGIDTPEHAAAMLRLHGVEALVLTTPSHTAERPRWRVFAPLSRPSSIAERYQATAMLNGALGGVLSRESFTPAQCYYVGSIEGAHPQRVIRIHGAPIDTIEHLAQIAQHPSTHHGPNGASPITERHPLGTAHLQAPDAFAIPLLLDQIEPDTLDNHQWSELYRACKQAHWSHGTKQEVRAMLDSWCARYHNNNPGENDKLWRSIRETTIGWPWIKWHYKLQAAVATGTTPLPSSPPAPMPGTEPQAHATPAMPATPPPTQCAPYTMGDALDGPQQAVHFAGCIYVSSLDRIRAPNGYYMNEHTFNATFGGYSYYVNALGTKPPTDNAWKAATQGGLHQIIKVELARFLPKEPTGKIVIDVLGRKGINTWIKPTIEAKPGDISPWLDHIAQMLPDPNDQRILLSYMAYCAKYPGEKVLWMPVIQSCEGAGKNIIKFAMEYAMGPPYVYGVKSDQLSEGGSKFNTWMREKLFIVADEIKTDEKRKLVEILKPFITETSVEIQGKGVDQVMGDNFANWIAFTNYQDAVPVNEGSRRFAIFFSALQTEQDMIDRGLTELYFKQLYRWMREVGKPYIAHYLLNYPIGIDDIPVRAPKTSTTQFAIEASRGPIEQLIIQAVEDQLPGFRNGWISSGALSNLLNSHKLKPPSGNTIGAIYRLLGYRRICRAAKAYHEEAPNKAPSWLYRKSDDRHVWYFAEDQGYREAPSMPSMPTMPMPTHGQAYG